MKKLIAKVCIWILGKLGYDNAYVPVNEIKITIDARDVIKQMQKMNYELDQIKHKL